MKIQIREKDLTAFVRKLMPHKLWNIAHLPIVPATVSRTQVLAMKVLDSVELVRREILGISRDIMCNRVSVLVWFQLGVGGLCLVALLALGFPARVALDVEVHEESKERSDVR